MNLSQLQSLLQSQFPSALVVVKNPLNDGQHFHALLVSAEFEGISLVERHRSVLTFLSPYFDDGSVHACSVKTYTPEEWEKKKHLYPQFLK